MRRVLLVVAASSMMVAGCGKATYERKLEATIIRLKYESRVKKNLEPVAEDKKARDLSIYIRAPKGMKLAKTGMLSVGEGQFDLEQSYLPDKAEAKPGDSMAGADVALHVLARVKMAKKPPAKGGGPPPPAPPQRGDFTRDLIGVLTGIYGQVDKLETHKFAEETTPRNKIKFKRLIFTALDKEVNLYLYKQDAHEVALIFVFDPKHKNEMATKIELCLDNFAAGPNALNLFSGGSTEEPAAPNQNGPL